MAVLGILLIAAAAVVGVETIISNTEEQELEIFGERFSNLTQGEVFLYGAAAATVALLGLWLFFAALARSRRRRVGRRRMERRRQAQVQSVVQEKESTVSNLESENERLRRELEEERRQRDTMGGVAVPPGVGAVPHGDQVTDSVHKANVDTQRGTAQQTEASSAPRDASGQPAGSTTGGPVPPSADAGSGGSTAPGQPGGSTGEETESRSLMDRLRGRQ